MKSFRRFVALSVALVAVAAWAFPGTAAASHGRYLNLAWTKVSGTTVDFTYNASYRCSFFTGSPCNATVGRVLLGEETLYFGDGQSASIDLLVTAVDVSRDLIIVVGLDPNRPSGNTTDTGITHTYASAGPFTAYIAACCLLDTLVNAPGGNYRVETLVNLTGDDESPRTSVNPIVVVGKPGVQTFTIPATDPGGETIRFRLTTAAESAAANPSGMTIDPNTGVVSLDTTSLAEGLYYATVVIEALGAGGAVVSTTQANFLIQVVSGTTNQAPTFTAPTAPCQRTATVATQLTIALSATDPDAGQVVTLNNLGLPTGATFMQTAGKPATGTFSWTPTATQVGSHLVTFTAVDNGNPVASTQITCTINVQLMGTAVTFRGLSATRTSNGVVVRWKTASEVDTLGFNVYREVNGKRVRVNTKLTAAKARGLYSFVDRKAPKDKSVRYWIQVVNLDGSRNWYGPARVARM